MSTALKIAITLSSLIGFVSASHLATTLVRERFIRAVDMTKIGTALSLAVGLSVIVLPVASVLGVWLRFFVSLSLALGAAFLLAKRRQSRIERDLPKWLSSLIMRMRMGHSLQASLEEEIAKDRSSTRFHMLAIARVVSFSPQNEMHERSSAALSYLSPKTREIASEFRRIQLLACRQVEELERWRDQILATESFRRKSKQAMAQSRAQAAVLAVIYLALLVFGLIAFGWPTVKGSFQVSVPLFCLGSFWLWMGAGEVNWTV